MPFPRKATHRRFELHPRSPAARVNTVWLSELEPDSQGEIQRGGGADSALSADTDTVRNEASSGRRLAAPLRQQPSREQNR